MPTISRAERDALGLAVDRVVGGAGDARVHVGAAQLVGADVLAGGGLDQRRPAEEDAAGAAHHDRVVGQRRHVRAARRAMAEDDGDLLDAHRGEHALVAEHAPAGVLAGEHLRLQRQERAGRIHEVHDRQPVLDRDVERADRLFVTVRGYMAPPLIELSPAITITSRPLTTPMPTTTAACGTSPS